MRSVILFNNQAAVANIIALAEMVKKNHKLIYIGETFSPYVHYMESVAYCKFDDVEVLITEDQCQPEGTIELFSIEPKIFLNYVKKNERTEIFFHPAGELFSEDKIQITTGYMQEVFTCERITVENNPDSFYRYNYLKIPLKEINRILSWNKSEIVTVRFGHGTENDGASMIIGNMSYSSPFLRIGCGAYYPEIFGCSKKFSWEVNKKELRKLVKLVDCDSTIRIGFLEDKIEISSRSGKVTISNYQKGE